MSSSNQRSAQAHPLVSTNSNRPTTRRNARNMSSGAMKEEEPKIETPIASTFSAFTPYQRSTANAPRPTPPATVNLLSNDGRIFSVKVDVARRFGIVRNMLDHCIIEEGATESEPVPLARVSGHILELAITWVEQHQLRHPSPDNSMQIKEEEDIAAPINEVPEIYYKRLPKFSSEGAKTNQYGRTMHDLEYWDYQFLGALTPGKLQDLLEAANYLDSQELLESTCKMIAKMIKAELDVDGPDGVASFMQVPVSTTNGKQKKKAAETRIETESGESQSRTRPTHSVGSFINSRYRLDNKKKEKPIKSEDEVHWTGLVLPPTQFGVVGNNNSNMAEASTQAPEPQAEVSDAYVID